MEVGGESNDVEVVCGRTRPMVVVDSTLTELDCEEIVLVDDVTVV